MIIKSVEYISDYTLRVTFKDRQVRIADFKKFVTTSQQPMTNQFTDIDRFKTVYVEHGHLTWEDGQMDISAQSIYRGRFSPKP